MNIFYAKTVLYAYPTPEKLIDRIDDLVEKKALDSMYDYSPCIEQCEKIISLTEQKELLIKLKNITETVLDCFNEEECKYFSYKYFKNRPKEFFVGFDTCSRGYFRKQIRLACKFAKALEKNGFSDEIMEKEYWKIDFIKEVYRRVLERENSVNEKKLKLVINTQIRQKEKNIA